MGVARSTARRLLSMRRSGFARNQGRSGRQVVAPGAPMRGPDGVLLAGLSVSCRACATTGTSCRHCSTSSRVPQAPSRPSWLGPPEPDLTRIHRGRNTSDRS
ncbi:hypothetical protein ACFCX0_36270 [Streptomyces sp. NPDC056352]|uniref:hypothetical protein n=1 Tax=Streptomyces sp. NPDC056352 TaxID=3345791 RepID=UPI0035DF2F27